jgi:hypothetical protein
MRELLRIKLHNFSTITRSDGFQARLRNDTK